MRIFDAVTGRQQRQMVGHIGGTWDEKYDDGGMILRGGADGTLCRRELAAAIE